MRILIVAPRYRPYGQFYELPLGLAYISSYLKSKGKDVTFLNLNEYPDDKKFFEMVGTADVLCTGGLSVHYRQLQDIISNARKVNPKVRIILGGGIYSSDPELMLGALDIDVGIPGEGEARLNAVLDNVPAQPIDNLDDLPFPDYEGLGVRNYLDRQLCGDEHYTYTLDKPRCLPIISSRSCPHNCSFCFHPLGKVYRQRSLGNFFKEVEYLIETYQVNMLAVLDELISADKERLAAFCDRISKYQINWMAQIRADSVDRDTLKRMKAAGCHQVSIGVESGSNKVLESMNKHTTIERIGQTLEWAYELGLGIQGNFIFGDKAETVATAQETLDWWMAHRQYMLNLTYIIPYPGCDLYKGAVKSGLIPDKIDYLDKGCPTIALTPKIGAISRLVEDHKPLGVLYAKVISSKITGGDRYRGVLYNTQILCPHCEKEVEYTNLYDGSTNANMVRGVYRIGCRNCNQRFDVKKGELFI